MSVCSFVSCRVQPVHDNRSYVTPLSTPFGNCQARGTTLGYRVTRYNAPMYDPSRVPAACKVKEMKSHRAAPRGTPAEMPAASITRGVTNNNDYLFRCRSPLAASPRPVDPPTQHNNKTGSRSPLLFTINTLVSHTQNRSYICIRFKHIRFKRPHNLNLAPAGLCIIYT